MNDVITLCFPAKVEYIAPIRLAVSGIVSNLDMDVFQLENIKSCITESCMLLICSQKCTVFHVTVRISDDSIAVSVQGSDIHRIMECRECMHFNKEMARMMIEAMSTSSELVRDEAGALQQVTFTISLEG